MTTITSNGSFLIADKRVGVSYTSSSGNQSSGVGSTIVENTHDNNVKIFVPKKDEFSIVGERVMAYAISGSALTGERFMRSAKGIPLEKAVNCFSIARGVTGDNETFEVIGLTESKKTFKAFFKVFVDDNSIVRRSRATILKDGVYASGSGSSILTILRNINAISDAFIENQHILNTHMFMATLDEHSSSTYDAYSIEEDKLVTRLDPQKEAIDEALEIYSKAMVFKPGKK